MAMDRATDLLLIKKTYKNGLDANKPVFKDGEMVMEVEDHPVRINAAEKLAKLNGELIEKQEISATVSIAQQIIEAHDNNE